MKEYTKYQHVEKLGSTEVDGILFGNVYVFPKIDGTNAHAWFDGEKMRYGSRNRELSIDNDNAGFMAAMTENDPLTKLCKHIGSKAHVYGEWLVPHSLKTYRDSAWRKFYVFDISDGEKHMKYEDLQHLCELFSLEYIAPIRILVNPTEEAIFKCLDQNKFLIDGAGVGEGVVLKNYEFVNKYGRQKWAKVVTQEFKEKHNKEMGAPITLVTSMVEQSIIEEYVTQALIEKTKAKISNENDGWQSKFIPKLLGRVYHDVVTEHIWDAVKKHKSPTINFKSLNRFCIMKIKELDNELF